MIHFGLKTIFIHIPRTAGNSVSFVLRKYFDYNNYHKHKHKHEDLKYYYKHYKRQTEEYFKFTNIRNPFDKICSHYIFKRIIKHKECLKNNFNDWILKYYNNDITGVIFKPQLDFISINEKIKIDYIIRYENLEDDFKIVCKKLNIPFELGHQFSSKKGNYKKYYNKRSIEIINKIFKKDLEYFNYTF